MESKKGFTLIELLAVIVILAVLLLIAIPQAIKVMENSKKSALITEAYAFVKAVTNAKTLERGIGRCVPYSSDLSDYLDIKEGYNGKIVMARDVNGKWVYYVYFTDGNYWLVAQDGGNQIPIENVLTEEPFGFTGVCLGDEILDANSKYGLFSYTCADSPSTIVSWNVAEQHLNTTNTGGKYTCNVTMIVLESLLSAIDRNNTIYPDDSGLSPTISSSGGIDFSNISSNTNGNGFFYTKDNTSNDCADGINCNSYYFRGSGNLVNNFVRFGGFFWRIVRINEDESIRMVYIGKLATNAGQIVSSPFNSNYGDNSFVSYMYGNPTNYTDSSSNYTSDGCIVSSNNTIKVATGFTLNAKTGLYYLTGVTNGNYASTNKYYCVDGEPSSCNKIAKIKTSSVVGGTTCLQSVEYHNAKFSSSVSSPFSNSNDSYIKNYLDNFYALNLLPYSEYIADTGFCADRGLQNGTGLGSTSTLYSGGSRYSNDTPQFKCSSPSDNLYTVNNNKGNRKLRYPIGLLTMDEIIYAGGAVGISNSNFYLYTAQNYWTMTPYNFNSTMLTANNVYVQSNGSVNNNVVASNYGVRPVINLKSDVLIVGGAGTAASPYVIAT